MSKQTLVELPHIVIVEDEPIVISSLELCLQSYFSLEFFATGEEALPYIHKRVQAIDLIIIGVMLPDMDGLGLLSTIKLDSSLKSLKVIVQSALSREELSITTVKADFYLQKPWTVKQMLNIIRQSLEKEIIL